MQKGECDPNHLRVFLQVEMRPIVWFLYDRNRSSAILTISLADKFPYDNDAVNCGIFLIVTTATPTGEWFPHDRNEYDR